MRSSRNAATFAGGCAPTNSATTAPLRNALTAGMPRMSYMPAISGFASTSTFASTISPSRAAASRSSTGPSMRHGPHQAAQKSTTTGSSCERSSTSCSKVSVVMSSSIRVTPLGWLVFLLIYNYTTK